MTSSTPKFKSIVKILIALLLFSAGYLSNQKQITTSTTHTTQKSKTLSETGKNINFYLEKTTDETTIVTKIIDGDTIEVNDGIKIRLIGIDTPETVDPNRLNECYGREAANFTTVNLLNKTIELEKDVSDTDKYGRLLRYVFVDGKLFNNFLVSEGYATVSTYPPDVKYQKQFIESERFAKRNNIGLWGKCQ